MGLSLFGDMGQKTIDIRFRKESMCKVFFISFIGFLYAEPGGNIGSRRNVTMLGFIKADIFL